MPFLCLRKKTPFGPDLCKKRPVFASRKEAFTLLEVLLSLALLSIVIISLLIERNRSFHQALETHNYRKALRLGYGKLTEIQMGLEEEKEGLFEGEEGYSWKVEEEPLVTETEQGQIDLVKWVLEVQYPASSTDGKLILTAFGPSKGK